MSHTILQCYEDNDIYMQWSYGLGYYIGTSYERQMTDATDTYGTRRDNRIIHSDRQLFFRVESFFPLVMILWPACTRILYFE